MPRDPRGWVLQWLFADLGVIGNLVVQHANQHAYAHLRSGSWPLLVRQCNGVVLFGTEADALPRSRVKVAGLRRAVERANKPLVDNPTVAQLQAFILAEGVTNLLVYGHNTKAVREQVDVVLRAGLLPF